MSFHVNLEVGTGKSRRIDPGSFQEAVSRFRFQRESSHPVSCVRTMLKRAQRLAIVSCEVSLSPSP